MVSTMIFADWKAAKTCIAQKFEDTGRNELADYVWQLPTEKAFCSFCDDIYEVANLMNEIDWHSGKEELSQ